MKLALWTLCAAGLVATIVAVRLLPQGERLSGARDAIDYLAFGWTDSTQYAPGFSEERFRHIQRGMTREQVLGELGNPLRAVRLGEGGELWYYGWGPPDSNYWLRNLLLSPDGHVESITREFYVD